MSTSTPRAADHEHILELMPWYLNGTLPEDERRLIDHHISECLPCRKAINEERRLKAIVAERSASPDSLAHGLDRLLDRIDGERRGRAPHRNLNPGGLALAASLAVAAVAFWAIGPSTSPEDGLANGPGNGEFSTLTSGRARATRVDVVFRGGTSPDTIDALIREVGATVIAGPTEIGRYTIELDADTPANVEQSLESLRENPSVRLVTPTFEDGPP